MTAIHIPKALKPLPQTSDLSHYDRLFVKAHPDAGGKDFLQILNPNSLKVVTAHVVPPLAATQPDQMLQFDLFGNFLADRLDHETGAKPVFNQVTGIEGFVG